MEACAFRTLRGAAGSLLGPAWATGQLLATWGLDWDSVEGGLASTGSLTEALLEIASQAETIAWPNLGG